MKIAVISDIHGNSVALEAVLQDLARQGPVDQIIIGGDPFAFGPAPQEVYNILRQLNNAHYLMGNTDRYLLQRNYPTSAQKDEWQDKLLLSFQWTAEHLEPEAIDFMRSFPATQNIQLGRRQLLAVHGSPRSDEEGLTEKTHPEDLQAMNIDSRVIIITCGHTHIPMNRVIGNVRVVNSGSAGLPFDGDPRGCYAILSNLENEESHAINVALRRIPYDIEKAVAQFYALDYPAADVSAYNLRTGRSVGSDLIYTDEMRKNSKSNQQ